MNLLLICGSPHREGNTFLALSLLGSYLEEVGVSYTLFHVGVAPVGCLGCGNCASTRRCAVEDRVNEALDLIAKEEFDGYVFASPVHYGAVCGGMTGFLDRFFRAGKPLHIGKCGAAIAVARRAGGISTCDQLLRYFPLFSMTAIGGDYWNVLYGTTHAEILADTEGLSHLRATASAFATFLTGKQA